MMEYTWYNQTIASPQLVQVSEMYLKNIALEVLGEPAPVLSPAGWMEQDWNVTELVKLIKPTGYKLL